MTITPCFRPLATAALAALLAWAGAAAADEAGDTSAAGLAKKLANPLADLVSVPFQFN